MRLPEPRTAAVGLALLVALIAVAGVLHASGNGLTAPTFDLDGEKTLPALISGGLLLLASVLAAAAARAGIAGWPTWSLAALFGFMAADEVLHFHEFLEWRLGVDWQALYAPLMLAAAVGWLGLLRWQRREGLSVVPLLGGAAAWAVSQVLEFLQWDGADEQVAAYVPLMVIEEILEMVGSALFVLALLHTLEWARDRRGHDRPEQTAAATRG